jgi:hypothetical protein
MFPPSTQAAARWAKILLLATIALFFTLVSFTNVTGFDTDYSSNRSSNGPAPHPYAAS